ncbi:MAG: methyltransferase domain-containing protein [Candidatus Aenigmarchaeota archaeon]|nr:methyltransferase domain-containing protein [Candidatus Aenigmarchaeota archaeon]
MSKISVIEIGFGTGITTKNVLEADKRIVVIAADNEIVMLKQAKFNLKNYIENKRVTFVLEDAVKFLKKQLPASFDCFVSYATMHNFDKTYRSSVLKEIFRVLKPGGLFVNGDKYALDNRIEFKRSFGRQIQRYKNVFTKMGRPDLLEQWTRHEELYLIFVLQESFELV